MYGVNTWDPTDYYASLSGHDLYEVHEIQTDYKHKNRVYICVITSVRVRNPLQKERFRHLCTACTAQAQTSSNAYVLLFDHA